MRAILLLGCLGLTLTLVLGASRLVRHPSVPDQPGAPRASVEELDWQYLVPGEPAPPFALPPVAGGSEVTLAEFRGQPVVLVFGSFTCNMFCGYLERVGELARAYAGRVAFVFVYARDAGHPAPADGPLCRYDMQLAEPERRHSIGDIWDETGLPLRCLYAGDGPVPKAYHAFPMRLVVIDPTGRVAYDAGNGLRGGWDYKMVRQHLEQEIRAESAE